MYISNINAHPKKVPKIMHAKDTSHEVQKTNCTKNYTKLTCTMYAVNVNIHFKLCTLHYRRLHNLYCTVCTQHFTLNKALYILHLERGDSAQSTTRSSQWTIQYCVLSQLYTAVCSTVRWQSGTTWPGGRKVGKKKISGKHPEPRPTNPYGLCLI